MKKKKPDMTAKEFFELLKIIHSECGLKDLTADEMEKLMDEIETEQNDKIPTKWKKELLDLLKKDGGMKVKLEAG